MAYRVLASSVMLLVLAAASVFAAAPSHQFPSARAIQAPPDKTDTIGDALNVSVIGRWADGSSQTVIVENGLVYHGRGPLLEIFTFDPDDFEREPIGRLEMPSLVSGLRLRDGLLYVANYWGGLRIVDVSDPVHPFELGSVAIDGTAWRVDLMGGLAVVPTSGQGVVLVDVTDPESPYIVNRITGVQNPFSVQCVGHLAYLADRTAGFHIYDLSNPLNPLMLWRITGAAGWDVEVHGTLAYLPIEAGLLIADVSNPNYPEIVGRAELPPSTGKVVTVVGDIAFVGVAWVGTCLVDVSDPRAPALLAVVPAQFDVFDLTASGGKVLVASAEGGLHLIDAAVALHPVLSAVRPTGGQCRNLVRDGSLAVVASGWGGLHVVDVANETKPRTVGHWETRNEVWHAVGSGLHAVVSEGVAGVAVMDLTDPTTPQEAGRYVADSFAQMLGADVQGDFAFVAQGGESGLRILDISNPASPTGLSLVPLPYMGRNVSVEGNVACVAAGDLFVIDIHDPSLPALVARVDMPGLAQDVAIADGYAYVVVAGTVNGSLHVVDIRNPATAHEIGRLEAIPKGYGVDAAFPYVYVAGSSAGLRVFDVSDRTHPVHVGHFVTVDFPRFSRRFLGYTVPEGGVYGQPKIHPGVQG